MARPSIKTEREAEILDAFESCVVKYGVEGATLQKIADAAGLARPLLRHYVGNKEALVNALVDRHIEEFDRVMVDLKDWLPDQNRVSNIIDSLFEQEYASTTNDAQLMHAFALAAQTRPDLYQRMQIWYLEFQQFLEDEIRREYRAADCQAIHIVATGIIGIYHNADHVVSLGRLGDFHHRSKQAALRLLSTLKCETFTEPV